MILTFSKAAMPSLHSDPRDRSDDRAFSSLHVDYVHQIINDHLHGGHTFLQDKQTKQEERCHINYEPPAADPSIQGFWGGST